MTRKTLEMGVFLLSPVILHSAQVQLYSTKAMNNPFKLLNKSEWYFILVWLVAIALIGLNEAGYGGIAYLPLMLLEVWLIKKAYGEEKPSE